MSLLETTESQKAAFNRLQEGRIRVEAELGKAIIGQKDVVEQILLALISGGHCIITGAPGLAKTLLVKSVAKVFRLNFQRVQFTPDLMPADITGTEILTETPQGRQLTFAKGPIFTNLLLADEINRTPPKTQSALLEAMQEHQVTAAGSPHPFRALLRASYAKSSRNGRHLSASRGSTRSLSIQYLDRLFTGR